LGFTFSEETSDKGLKISNLSEKGVVSKTDFRRGDIIVSINDHRITSQRDFMHWLHAGRNDRITVVVLRDDREETIFLDPDVIFVEETVASSGGAWLGVDLYDRFSRAAVVLKVHPNSPAERAGLRNDDLIVAVDGEEITSPEHLGQVIGAMQPGTDVEVEVERNRRVQVVDARLGRREDVSQRTIRTQPAPRR
jgi:S1-C subfamily serine protease